MAGGGGGAGGGSQGTGSDEDGGVGLASSITGTAIYRGGEEATSFNQPLHAPWYAVEQSDSE